MKHEYKTGKKARECFEDTMKALFRVPKATPKKPEKPISESKKEGAK